MVERGPGTIVNLLSRSDNYAMLLLAEYGAAEMFMESFLESLDTNYRGKGGRGQCQVPFCVATKLAKMRASATMPTAGAYVGMWMGWLGPGGVVQPVSARSDVHSVLRCGGHFHFVADCNCHDAYCIIELRLFFLSS